MAGFTNRQSYNGVSYKVYVPENCNANTEVLVYCHGGGDYESWYGTDYLKQNGSDTIVIFPTGDAGFRETNQYGAQVVDVVNQVKQQYNITNNNFSVAGFSMGSKPTYTIMGEYLKQNPNNNGLTTMYLLDNYPNANVSGINKFDSLLNDYGSYYKSNNTMFVAMIPQWNGGTYIIGSKQKELDYLVQHGITNVSVLHSRKATFPGSYPDLNLGGDSHQVVEQGFWVDGFFNTTKNASVTYGDNEYNLTIYNKVTGQYEVTNFANLNSLDKLRQYFGINITTGNNTATVTPLNNGTDFLKDEISKLAGLTLYETSNKLLKSDKDVLLGNVNNVISDIKNTSFVSSGLNLGFSGSSTTKVPSGIPNIIGLYFTFTTNMLTELSDFMNTVATAGENIDKMDKDLEKDASNLNDQVQLKTDTSTFNDLSTTDTPLTATPKDTTNEVTTFVRDNANTNTTTGTNASYGTNSSNGSNSNNTGSYGTVTNSGNRTYSSGSYGTNSYSSSAGSNNSNPVSSNTAQEQVSAIPQDTWEEVTTYVRGDSVGATPNVNSGNTGFVSIPNDVVSTPEVSVDTTVKLPEVDIPKHDINNINIGNSYTGGDVVTPTPEVDNILNNNDLINVPVTSPTVEPKNNSLSGLGIALGVGATLGVGGVVAAKAFSNNKNDSEEDNEDSDISQYKDDYYEEV